jgi:riboflavin kinase / FMN adenylyltransferase
MRIFRHYGGLPDNFRQAVIAIGNFDGVHLGHQGVIQEAGRIAAANGVPWGVMTFEPHPRMFFKPDQPSFRITPMRAKSHAVAALDVDFMVVLRFDEDLATMEAEHFIQDVLVKNLDVYHVVCGYDFSFGKGAVGNCGLLLHMGMEAGFGMTAVGAIDDETGKAYSSTRVREYLSDGDLKSAARLLDRPFEISGRVNHGDKRGRTIGFPTANIHLEDYMEPARGVYAIRATLDTGDEPVWLDGVANLGIRPMFETPESVLEVYIFDFEEDLYDRHLRVQLVEYIRPEEKLDGLDALKSKISEDCDIARVILGKS